MAQITERELEYLQASIFHCKSQMNMGRMPDPVMTRFVVDMAQRLADQPGIVRSVLPPSRYTLKEKGRKSEDAVSI